MFSVHRDPKSPSSSQSSSSSPSSYSSRYSTSPSSPSTPNYTNSRQQKQPELKERSNESAIYSLRPRDRKQGYENPGNPSSDDAPQFYKTRLPFLSHPDSPHPIKPGRLEKWQLDILQEVFDKGIWSPGDATIETLKRSLKDRTDKQIRDWFAHRRRRLRESGVSMERCAGEEGYTQAVEGLLLLGRQDEDEMEF